MSLPLSTTVGGLSFSAEQNLYVLAWYSRPMGIWSTQPLSLSAPTCLMWCLLQGAQRIHCLPHRWHASSWLYAFGMLCPPSGITFLPSLPWHIPVSSGTVSAHFSGVLEPLILLTVWYLLYWIKVSHQYLFFIPLFEGSLATTVSSSLGP